MAQRVKRTEITATITATFPATLPANQKVFATITLDPALGAVSQQQVPVKEVWVVEDIYVTATQTPDAILEFVKNLVDSMFRTAPVNALIVTNPSRPVIKPVMYKGADIMTIVAQNLAVIGAAAETVTAYAKFVRFG